MKIDVESRQAVLEFMIWLDEPMAVDEIMAATGKDESLVRDVLAMMYEDDLLVLVDITDANTMKVYRHFIMLPDAQKEMRGDVEPKSSQNRAERRRTAHNAKRH